MAAMDYGAIIFKNGVRYKEDELFPSIDELNIVFYKNCILNPDDNIVIKQFGWAYYDSFEKGWHKKSYRFLIDGNDYWVKEICPRVYKCHIRTKEDKYDVIFGYGIDYKKEIWDIIKVKYLGKRNARAVDKVLSKYDYK